MSLAVKCDRKDCGMYFVKEELDGIESSSFSYTTFNDHSTLENGYQYHKKGTFDLCPRCTRELFTKFLGIDIHGMDAVSDVKSTKFSGPLNTTDLLDIPDIEQNPFGEAISGFIRRSDKHADGEKKGWDWSK